MMALTSSLESRLRVLERPLELTSVVDLPPLSASVVDSELAELVAPVSEVSPGTSL